MALLAPSACFPVIFSGPPASALALQLEADIRARVQHERQEELTRMHDRVRVALARRDAGSITDECGQLVDAILEGRMGVLASPLEQTLYAVISARTVAPPDLSPAAIAARDAAPTCYALYLAVACIEALPVGGWETRTVVRLLFGLDNLLGGVLEQKERTLRDASRTFADALSKADERLRAATRRIVAALDERTPAAHPDKALLQAWMGNARATKDRADIAHRLNTLLLPDEEEEEEEEATAAEDDIMDTSQPAPTALPI